MSDNKGPSEANIFRTDLGCRILIAMDQNDDLPVSNIYRLSKTMQEYFNTLGMIDEVKERGYSWRPNEDYWRLKMNDLAKNFRRDKGNERYFGFVREQGSLTGLWKFMSPGEWEYINKRDHADIGTRIESHNEKIVESHGDFKVELPYINTVPLLN